jgi:hypothetical protein
VLDCAAAVSAIPKPRATAKIAENNIFEIAFLFRLSWIVLALTRKFPVV